MYIHIHIHVYIHIYIYADVRRSGLLSWGGGLNLLIGGMAHATQPFENRQRAEHEEERSADREDGDTMIQMLQHMYIYMIFEHIYIYMYIYSIYSR